MGMLLRRHYVNNSDTKGAINEVAPDVEETKEVVTPSKSEKSATNNEVLEKKYTRTEINRTSTSDLKKMAVSNGIEGAESLTGSELKKLLIDKLV